MANPNNQALLKDVEAGNSGVESTACCTSAELWQTFRSGLFILVAASAVAAVATGFYYMLRLSSTHPKNPGDEMVGAAFLTVGVFGVVGVVVSGGPSSHP